MYSFFFFCLVILGPWGLDIKYSSGIEDRERERERERERKELAQKQAFEVRKKKYVKILRTP